MGRRSGRDVEAMCCQGDGVGMGSFQVAVGAEVEWNLRWLCLRGAHQKKGQRWATWAVCECLAGVEPLAPRPGAQAGFGCG